MSLKLTTEKATLCELQTILDIFNSAIQEMEKNKIDQWDSEYPNRELIVQDIINRDMYVVKFKDEIVSVFVLNKIFDPQYFDAQWEYKNHSFNIVHRLCVNPKYQHKGIGTKTMLLAEDIVKAKGIETIRLDVFTENPYANKLYTQLGYKNVGNAHFRKGDFYLMEKKVK
ncbi:MAG TPA: GNAT family N-acetyltransferase [Clostridiales bacterium]|nr:GNAT family N-acetyltransferase [Clostridiales bacterium]